MAGDVATREGSSSSSNSLTRTQIFPLNLVNEIQKSSLERLPVPYLAPSTLRALKVDSIMRPVTATLDSIFMKDYNTTQMNNMNLMYPSTLPNRNGLPNLARPQQSEWPEMTCDQRLEPDRWQTRIACPVQSEALASNERHRTASANPKASASPITAESFTHCLCPTSYGLPRKNLPPNSSSSSNVIHFTIDDALKSHEKDLIRCYPELAFLRTVPLIIEPIPSVNSASYLSFLSDLLNTHMYPPENESCATKSYFQDSRQVNDISSMDEDENVLFFNSKSGRVETRKPTALYSDHIDETGQAANWSLNSSEESTPSLIPNDSSSDSDQSLSGSPSQMDYWNSSFDSSSDLELPPLKIIKLDFKISGPQ